MSASRDTQERYALIRQVSIFEGLGDDAVAALNEHLRPKRFTRDSLIVGQDDEGEALYIIRRGRVKVALTGENGREVILALFREGDFFGEMSLLDGRPRSANVIASENTDVLMLLRQDFESHLRRSPDTALRVLAEMCGRLRRADEVIGSLALLDVYGRVARTLIDLSVKEGVAQDEGILIRERPTQQDLASMIGTSRETVSRVLSEFRRRGFLSMQGKSVLLSHGFAEQLQTEGPNSL